MVAFVVLKFYILAPSGISKAELQVFCLGGTQGDDSNRSFQKPSEVASQNTLLRTQILQKRRVATKIPFSNRTNTILKQHLHCMVQCTVAILDSRKGIQ